MNEIPQLSGMTSSVLSEVTVGVDDGSAQHLHIHNQPGPVSRVWRLTLTKI